MVIHRNKFFKENGMIEVEQPSPSNLSIDFPYQNHANFPWQFQIFNTDSQNGTVKPTETTKCIRHINCFC